MTFLVAAELLGAAKVRGTSVAHVPNSLGTGLGVDAPPLGPPARPMGEFGPLVARASGVRFSR